MMVNLRVVSSTKYDVIVRSVLLLDSWVILASVHRYDNFFSLKIVSSYCKHSAISSVYMYII